MNSFFSSWYRFGIIRTFWSKDFCCALLITLLALFLKHYHQVSIIVKYDIVISVMAGLFAFIFAALAIMISLSDEKFLAILKKADVFDDFMFHYWFGCTLYLVGIASFFLLEIFNMQGGWCDYFVLFIFLYAIFFSIELVKTTINFGVYREKFINRISE